MIQINIETIKEIVQQLYVSKIKNFYGDEGIAALRSVLETIHAVFRSIEPEVIRGTVVVFKNVKGVAPGLDAWKCLTDLTYSVQECPIASETYLNLQVCSNGIIKYSKAELNLAELSEVAVVYLYKDKTEGFLIQGKFEPIPNPYRPYASVFSVPTYSVLRDALEDYRRRVIKTSRGCQVFGSTWHQGAGGPRLFFIRKPEAKIRQSLSYFLDSVLRGAEVAPEQNVDETRPVDIKVTWMCSNRLALIEIKWLGKSVDESGELKTEYTESRANDGARQLVDYIDTNYRNTPIHNRRGYLVVVDARRRGLQVGAKSISKRGGLWYQDRDITFTPDYHAIRTDFEEPMRMFAEPICLT